ESAKKRLRPILITSLTTILGMMPVALGLGDGGRILQPLGIAVSGGLWVSMGLTLFVAPALQVLFLKKKNLAREAETDSGLAQRVEVSTGILSKLKSKSARKPE